jgi:hypothetical protein
MSRISIRADKKAVRKALGTFANIGAVALLTLTVNTGYATPSKGRPRHHEVKSIKTAAALVLGVGVWLRSDPGHGDIRVRWDTHDHARE